jgi:hypothetical protein
VNVIVLGSVNVSADQITVKIAADSRRAATVPPWSAGRVGFPIRMGENASLARISPSSTWAESPRKRAYGMTSVSPSKFPEARAVRSRSRSDVTPDP